MVKLPNAYDSGLGQSQTRGTFQQQQPLQYDATASGRTIAQAGQSMVGMSQALFDIQDKMDTTALQEADLAFLERSTPILSDYYSTDLKNTLNAYKPTLDSIEGLSKEIMEGLPNERVKRQFANILQKRMIDINDRVTNKFTIENKKNQIAVTQSLISEIQKQAELNYTDVNVIPDSKNRLKSLVDNLSELQGLAPEVKKELLSNTVNSMYFGIVNKIIAENPEEAPQYIERPDIKQALQEMGSYEKVKDYATGRLLKLEDIKQKQLIYDSFKQNSELMIRALSGGVITLSEVEGSGIEPEVKQYIMENRFSAKRTEYDEYVFKVGLDKDIESFDGSIEQRQAIEKKIADATKGKKPLLTADQAIKLRKELKVKLLTPIEKVNAKADIDRKIQVVINNKNSEIKDFAETHKQLVGLLNNFVINEEEFIEKFSTFIEPYIKILQDNLKKEQKTLGIKANLGFEEIQDFITEVSPAARWFGNIEPLKSQAKDAEVKKKENERIKFLVADTTIKVLNLYIENLKEILEENNLDIKTAPKMNGVKKGKLVIQAVDKTKIDYANGLGYNVKSTTQAKNAIAYHQANEIQNMARAAIDQSLEQSTQPKVKFVEFK